MIKNYFESLPAGTDSFSGLAAVFTAVAFTAVAFTAVALEQDLVAEALEQDFALVPALQQDFLVVAVLTVVADALLAVQAALDLVQVLVAVVLVAAAFAAAACGQP